MRFLNGFIFILVSVALSAQAQESDDTANANRTSQSQMFAAPRESLTFEANTATLSEKTPVSLKKWLLMVVSESYTNGRDQLQLGSAAPVNSLLGVGAGYQWRPTSVIELRQHLDFASNRERLKDRAAMAHQDSAMVMSFQMLRATFASDWKLGSSAPVAGEFRYYLPTDRASRQNRENGMFRADAWTEWMMSPRWSVGGAGSVRLLFNSADNPNAAVGSDAEYYRLLVGPSLIYAFKDSLKSYYAYTVDGRSRGAQRGHWAFDTDNTARHEVGVNWTIGSVLLNPCVSSDTSNGDRTAALLTPDSRVFSAETINMNLNVSAQF